MVGALASELRSRLIRKRSRAVVLDRDQRRLVVFFRDATLVVDLAPGSGDVYLGSAEEPPDHAVRVPAHLRGVEAVEDERVLLMTFKRVRGKATVPGLVIDFRTNRWNAYFTEGAERKVKGRLTPGGPGAPAIGQPWVPPRSDRSGSQGNLTAPEWAALVEGAEDAGSLMGALAYTSSLNVNYLSDSSRTAESRWLQWKAMCRGEGGEAVLWETKQGLQAYPWPVAEAGERFPTFLAALEASRRPSADRFDHDTVVRQLDKVRKGLLRKRNRLAEQLDRASDAEGMRQTASLILSSLHNIPEGSSTVTLMGFDGESVSIELDPAHPPQKTAEKLFKKATRLEGALKKLPGEIAGLDEQVALVEERVRGLSNGTLSTEAALEGIDTSHHRRASSQTPGDRNVPLLPYRRYTSSGGVEIRVGRGAGKNDDLTFRHSRPGDVWLHARYVAGAHVILRWDRKEPPPARDLEEAAILAALHSKARHSAHVPVDWTRRRFVRKPRGAAPGSVVPDQVKTIFVTPDERLLEQMKNETSAT